MKKLKKLLQAIGVMALVCLPGPSYTQEKKLETMTISYASVSGTRLMTCMPASSRRGVPISR